MSTSHRPYFTQESFTSLNREESMGHDIFLSHSGKQKGFVNDLHIRLSSSYTVFFDITDHSLPPAEKFPPRIFEAARKCKLAVVILSNDFVVSYWPMLELCAFVRASPSVKILPLFYQLSPSDLKNEDNLAKWRKAWNTHAAQQSNSKHSLDVLEWEKALKSLCSLNGIIFDPSIAGEQAYLDKIVSKISKTVPPAVKYDDSGIHGKDRLCKIILAKFAELEARMLQPSNKQYVPPQSRVCLLAMCGLPGSGKSTLCKCLCNHYFPFFDGKVHYIDLPTNPTNEQLAKKCKELLDRLTNFRNMVDLTHAPDLRQIYHVLRTSNLQSSRIFLVLDNISQETLQFVQKILRFVVGPGSKVLLVARTLDVLESFLDPQIEQSHYVCTSMNVPSLDEKEAIRVLLQSRDNGDLPDQDLNNPDRQIMEKVVCMSGFGDEDNRLYLPLVMKIMGVQLRQYKLDVKKWGRDMGSFWTRVEKCKERAVMELVQESFLQLSKRLQLLFLDLALFMQQLSAIHIESLQACNILSIMHDCSPDDIFMDMLDLQRHCFVEDVNVTKIHDMFLEFAASIPESSMYYASCRSCVQVDYMLPPPSSQALEFGLRAVVLELNEGRERFDFWPGFSNVKALVFRNSKKLAVLGLKGLTSLLILHIDNCPSLKSVELPDHVADCRKLLDSIQWLRWVETQGQNHMVMQHGRSNNMVQTYAEQGKQVVNNAWSWFAGMIGASRIERPARMEVRDLAFQMSRLQVLDLQNTGIKDLGDLSMCWPLLRELTIVEKSLEHIEVGTLSYLKRFIFFCDDGTESNQAVLTKHSEFVYRKLKASPRGFKKKNLLVGCPALEDIFIRSASFEDVLGTLVTPKLHRLWLANFWHAEKLPNLGACAESLECLVARECGELRSVDFMDRFESEGWTNLRRLVHHSEEVTCEAHCRTLLGLTMLLGVSEPPHLSHLTSISCLRLVGVQDLASLRGIGFLHPLKTLELKNLQNLSCLQGIESLTNLEGLLVGDCASVEELPSLSQLVNMSALLLENCVKLRTVEGCSAMTNLVRVVLIGCKSMACFPLDDTTVRCIYPNLNGAGLRVEGSKFASREMLVSWILDEDAADALHVASVVALKWELCRSLREKPREQMELAMVLLERLDDTKIARNNPPLEWALLELLCLCEQVAQGNTSWNTNEDLFSPHDYVQSGLAQDFLPERDIVSGSIFVPSFEYAKGLFSLVKGDTSFDEVPIIYVSL